MQTETGKYRVYKYNCSTHKKGELLGDDLGIMEADALAMKEIQKIKEENNLNYRIKRITSDSKCVFQMKGTDESFLVIIIDRNEQKNAKI